MEAEGQEKDAFNNLKEISMGFRLASHLMVSKLDLKIIQRHWELEHK